MKGSPPAQDESIHTNTYSSNSIIDASRDINLSLNHWPPYDRFGVQTCAQAERLLFLNLDDDDYLSRRLYRAKLKVDSPISSSDTQALAVIFLFDLHLLDKPIRLAKASIGAESVGDLSQKSMEYEVTIFITLSHTIRFVKTDGIRADDGVLLEIVFRRIKNISLSYSKIRDKTGCLVATVEQEVIVVCDPHTVERLRVHADPL